MRNHKYSIVKVLGQGGFGITYLAKMRTVVSGALGEMDIEVDVAIKEFFIKDRLVRAADTNRVTSPSEGSAELVERYRRKFVKEARNIASMSHPNIVKVTDVFEENDTVYYVMQFLPGGSLSSYVKNHHGGRLEDDEAVNYIMQVGRALQYMHEEKKACHLDVKPGNILLNKNHEAVLIDFGLSKGYDDEGQQTSTTPVGISTGYAPLEQYQQSLQSFSPQTDVYSLGATLFFLLTGTTPPEASVVNEDGLPENNYGISPALWAVIEKAMEPRRRQRYQSMGSMLADLQKAVAGDDSTIVDEQAFRQSVLTEETRIVEEPVKREKKVEVAEFGADDDKGGLSAKLRQIVKQPLVFALLGCLLIGSIFFILSGLGSEDEETTGNGLELPYDTPAKKQILQPTSYDFSDLENITDTALFKPDYVTGDDAVYLYYGGKDSEGRLHGRGKRLYLSNDKYNRDYYVGSFDHGKITGPGKLVYKNGAYFIGMIDDGHFSAGTFKVDDDNFFVGTFKDDQPLNGYWLDKDSYVKESVGDCLQLYHEEYLDSTLAVEELVDAEEVVVDSL